MSEQGGRYRVSPDEAGWIGRGVEHHYVLDGGVFVADCSSLADATLIANALNDQAERDALLAALAFVTRETSTAYCLECGFLTFFEKDGEQQHEPWCLLSDIRKAREKGER